MRKDKQRAIKLRKDGKSYNQIRKLLNIPRSTLSGWLSKEGWSEEIREKLTRAANKRSARKIHSLNKTRGRRLSEEYERARREACEELEDLKYDPLFIAGVMLYWGEGAKDPKQGVKFTNSDPKMIAFYLQFLTRSCGIPIEKIKAYLLLYPQINEKTARAYWSKVGGIPWNNFTRSIVIRGRHATRRLGWGVCTLTVSSNYFKRQMLEWMRLLPTELLGRNYYEKMPG